MKKVCSVLLALLLALSAFSLSAAAEDPITVVSTLAEATAYVRSRLLLHEETVMFRYGGEDGGAPTVDDLCVWDGPDGGGDYLRLSFNGVLPTAARAEDGTYTVTAAFYTTAQQEAAVDDYVAAAAADCEAETNAEKARFVFDLLCETVQFDLENLYNDEDLLKYTAYGAVTNGRAVCQGFAALYYRIARAVGLPCRIVTGKRVNVAHAWNIVRNDEGNWVHVDASSGAQLLDPSPYFLRPSLKNYTIRYDGWTAPEIRDYAFAAADGISSGAITDTVSYIFNRTTGHLEISGTGSIPNFTFRDSSMQTVTIDEGITGVGSTAFYMCQNLREISFPSTATEIDHTALYWCQSLESIHIHPDNPVYSDAGNNVIERETKTLLIGCRTSVIPDDGSVEVIGENAFYEVPIAAITFPDSVKRIEGNAFMESGALTEIHLPGTIEELTGAPFNACGNLQRVTVAAGMTAELTGSTFGKCKKLVSVTVEDGNPRYVNDGSAVLSADRTKLILYPPAAPEAAYTVPETVTELGDKAFFCSNVLQDLYLPSHALTFGDYAFYNASNLQRVHIADLAAWCGTDFPSANANPLASGAGLCVNGETISDLVIPDGVTRLGDCAFFGCKALTSVTMADSVTGMGKYVFAQCKSLTDAVLSESLTAIGENAFDGCKKLQAIAVPDSVRRIEPCAFYECYSLASVTLPERMEFIGGAAFLDCEALPSIRLPQGITVIDNNTFYRCFSLKSLVIPDGVTAIKDNAFWNCSNLEALAVPDSVVKCYFEFRMFWGCNKLTLYGHRGSYIESQAQHWSFPFREVCAVTDSLHENVTVEARAATCTESGYSAGERCAACGEWVKEPTVTADPLGHEPGEPARENEIAPTCTEEGSYDTVVRCTRCGEILSSVHEKLATVPHADGNRDGYCDDCGAYICEHEETALVNDAPAACLTAGYSGDTVCLICGATILYGATIPATGHAPAESSPAVPATCLDEGRTAEFTCTVCGAVTSPAAPTPIAAHADRNADGKCDVCLAPVACKIYGRSGDGTFWYLENGVLAITGTGETTYTSAPWEAYRNDFDTVYVAVGVTAVNAAVFTGSGNLTRVVAPAATVLTGCEKPVVPYIADGGNVTVTAPETLSLPELLNLAYVFCADRTLKALSFRSLALTAPEGWSYIEYDVLKNGKIVDENHFRLPSGTAVADFTVSATGYASFNDVMDALGENPDRNLILKILCDDLLPADMRQNAGDYTEQLVIHFVDQPTPPQPDDEPEEHKSFLDRFRATLAAILALFKKIFKWFTK